MDLTSEQQEVLDGILKWVKTKNSPVAILTGGAGTGKTTLLRSVVDELQTQKISYGLLAPTGRASRILGQKTGRSARTIHAEIYMLGDIVVQENPDSKQLSFDAPEFMIPFVLKKTDPGAGIFIVDEASMVSDIFTQSEVLSFGTGRLLYDLLDYSRVINQQNNNSKILFVGDVAQLPPIKSQLSPALSSIYFVKEYGIKPQTFNLEKVLRQDEGSLVLDNAERVREGIKDKNYKDFEVIGDGLSVNSQTSEKVIDTALENYDPAKSIIITVSNRSALSYNRAIRKKRFGVDRLPVQVGDTLLVCRNSIKHNFFNGDLVKVVHVGASNECRTEKLRGSGKEINMYFRNITVQQIDGDDKSLKECKMFENLLDCPSTTLGPEENQAIMTDFRKRHQNLKTDSEEFRLALVGDEYFNALIVQYGYAITCNKAQGGEWEKVTVNFEWSGPSEGFFRWAYTAITRSKKILTVVNAPKFGKSIQIPIVQNELSIKIDPIAVKPKLVHDEEIIIRKRVTPSQKKEIVRLLEEGESCKNIANQLTVSPPVVWGVKSHWRQGKYNKSQEKVSGSPGSIANEESPRKKHGGKWSADELERLSAYWIKSDKIDADIAEICEELGRSPLAILIQLFKAEIITLEQADFFAEQSSCAKLVSEAIPAEKRWVELK